MKKEQNNPLACAFEWHVTTNNIRNGMLIPSDNNPKCSGNYICTCVTKSEGLAYKFVTVKRYNAAKRKWYDINSDAPSFDAVLAWAYIQPCAYNNFDYVLGTVVEKGSIKKNTRRRY